MKTQDWVTLGVGAGLLYWLAKRQPSSLSGLSELADLGKKLAKPKRVAKGRVETASADKPVIPFLATIENEKSSTAAVNLILDAWIYKCLKSIDNVNRQIFAGKGMYIDGLVQGGYPELEGHVEVIHGAMRQIVWDIATMLRVDVPPMCGKIFGDSSPVRVAWEPSLTLWNSAYGDNRGLGNTLITPMIEMAQNGWNELLGKVKATRSALSGDWYALAWFYEQLLTGGGSWLKPSTSWIIDSLSAGAASIWVRGKTMSMLNFVRKGSKGNGWDSYLKSRKRACSTHKSTPCPTCYKNNIDESLEAIYCAVFPQACGQAPKAQPQNGGGGTTPCPAPPKAGERWCQDWWLRMPVPTTCTSNQYAGQEDPPSGCPSCQTYWCSDGRSYPAWKVDASGNVAATGAQPGFGT